MLSSDFALLLMCALMWGACQSQKQPKVEEGNLSLIRAAQTLDSLYARYALAGTCLLLENDRDDSGSYTATYLASEEQQDVPNRYSYLWPYSGTFSAVNALYEATGAEKYKKLVDERVLPGLEQYYDTRRMPPAYASYINTEPLSDRFYDDNIWLGIDFVDLYAQTRDDRYLQKARLIWDFICSGTDRRLGGGVYWCEQKKGSKNTCSNAPASVMAFKLFRATGDSVYFRRGLDFYRWTKTTLQDTTDYLYFDNISLEGKIGRAKYAYNSGQMMQAAALLHRITGEQEYLDEARTIAEGCYHYFFADFTPKQGLPFKMLKKGDVWFSAVMLRGFIELYDIDHNALYIDAFRQSLDYAWTHARNGHGLFNSDFSGQHSDKRYWLLTQAAVVEMYARLAVIEKG